MQQPATGRGKREGARTLYYPLALTGRHTPPTPPCGAKGGERAHGRSPRGVRGRGPQRRALCVCTVQAVYGANPASGARVAAVYGI